MQAAPEADRCKCSRKRSEAVNAGVGSDIQDHLPQSRSSIEPFHHLMLDERLDSAKGILQTISICISSR